MSHSIIEVENISKRYQIGANKEKYLSIRDEVVKSVRRVSSGIAGMFSQNQQEASDNEQDFWALKDVSFNVQQGEAVGIIGRNGAGKSTLLKILSQITPPTTGKITCRGRIASLLEVGTGFHPELTGRENIYLNGTIMGMSRSEVVRKFDEIVAFAEVEKFLDTPVKRYSSGMYVRLAFAVAAHLDPEILVVDEVLAVGDAQFQEKCLGKMSDVAKGGRTVIFVSHNMAAMTRLCDRGIVLVNGGIIYESTAEAAVGFYLGTIGRNNGKAVFTSPQISAGIVPPHFTSCELLGINNLSKDQFYTGELMKLKIEVTFPSLKTNCVISFIVKSLTRGFVYHIMTTDANLMLEDLTGNLILIAIFPKLPLYPGSYIVDDLWLGSDRGQTLALMKDVLSFTVFPNGPFVNRVLPTHAGIVHEVPLWTVEKSNR